MREYVDPFKVLTIAVLLLGLVSVVQAQNTGKISGEVIDAETGEALPGANVIVGETSLGAAVDANGEYYIINISPGTYEVRASMVGYATVTKTNVQVNADLTTEIDFELAPAVFEGEEVTIVAERPVVDKDVTGSVSIINAEDMDRLPSVNFDDLISQQTGVFSSGDATYVRGGMGSELNYIVDGVSQQSGLLGDNWQRLNTSAIQEVSLLTGGYSAEYGQAMSGIVNITQKEASREQNNLHGTLRYQLRPAGKYHWGSNIYSQDLYKYTHYDLGYWEEQLQDPENRSRYADYFGDYYGWNGEDIPTAEQLHNTYREQLTPAPVLDNYTERMQQEGEATFWGSFSRDWNFLLSGRYLRGVHIYPTAQAYQPEYNLTGRVNYYFTNEMKLTLFGTYGGYDATAQTESQLNSLAAGEGVGQRVNLPEVRDPYTNFAYAPWGAQRSRLKGPQKKTMNTLGLQWRHVLSPATFYTAQVSFLRDEIENFQDYSHDEFYSVVPRGEQLLDLSDQFRLVSRREYYNYYMLSKAYTAEADFTSQISDAHQIKAGARFELNDLTHMTKRVSYESPENIANMGNFFFEKPVSGALYVQDKVEYEGIVLNVGVRLDAFNTRKDYPASPLYDPLAVQEKNGGDGTYASNTEEIWWANMPFPDWVQPIPDADFQSAFDGHRQNKNTLEPEWKMAVSPRLGVSFPVTEYSKLRFSYGHFYQRPSWNMMLGRTYQWTTADPRLVLGEESQGWQGNPGLTYEKTIQYEVGYDQSIFEILRLNVTAYYKDQTRLTQLTRKTNYSSGGGISTSDPTDTFYGSNASWSANNAIFLRWQSNDSFKDVRGLEVSLAKLFTGQWSARATFDYSVASGGFYGISTYYEDPSRVDQVTTGGSPLEFLSDYRFKLNASYVTPSNLGPMDLLGGVTVSGYYEYFAGPVYTWYAPDFSGIREPNNKRWYPHQRADLKLSKQFNVGQFAPELGIQVINVFNFRDRRLPGGRDLDEWELRERLPIVDDTGEPDPWGFYNSVSNPRRMLYFTAGLTF